MEEMKLYRKGKEIMLKDWKKIENFVELLDKEMHAKSNKSKAYFKTVNKFVENLIMTTDLIFKKCVIKIEELNREISKIKDGFKNRGKRRAINIIIKKKRQKKKEDLKKKADTYKKNNGCNFVEYRIFSYENKEIERTLFNEMHSNESEFEKLIKQVRDQENEEKLIKDENLKTANFLRTICVEESNIIHKRSRDIDNYFWKKFDDNKYDETFNGMNINHVHPSFSFKATAKEAKKNYKKLETMTMDQLFSSLRESDNLTDMHFN